MNGMEIYDKLDLTPYVHAGCTRLSKCLFIVNVIRPTSSSSNYQESKTSVQYLVSFFHTGPVVWKNAEKTIGCPEQSKIIFV